LIFAASSSALLLSGSTACARAVGALPARHHEINV
jgi:hypothetical protein